MKAGIRAAEKRTTAWECALMRNRLLLENTRSPSRYVLLLYNSNSVLTAANHYGRRKDFASNLALSAKSFGYGWVTWVVQNLKRTICFFMGLILSSRADRSERGQSKKLHGQTLQPRYHSRKHVLHPFQPFSLSLSLYNMHRAGTKPTHSTPDPPHADFCRALSKWSGLQCIMILLIMQQTQHFIYSPWCSAHHWWQSTISIYKRTECEPSQFVRSREHSGRDECSK